MTHPTSRTLLASGIGFRDVHAEAFEVLKPAVGFLEVHAENYMAKGRARDRLYRLREQWSVSVHGVGLSLGSVERPDARHLGRLVELVREVEPILVSEHLSFSSVADVYLNDLLPLPMTSMALRVVARNVNIAQDALGRQLLIENPSRYLEFKNADLSEPEFFNELTQRTGCGVLLDVNNLHVSTTNLGASPRSWLAALEPSRVGEIHLAGHSRVEVEGGSLLVDDHGAPVSRTVWALFEHAVRAAPRAPVLVEWDSRVPPLPRLLAEAGKSDRKRMRALRALGPIETEGLSHALAY